MGKLLTVSHLFLGALLLCLAPIAGAAETPTNDRRTAAISHYHRATRDVATAGLLGPGGLEEARRLGFVLVIDWRTAAEGAASEARAAANAGLRYLNLPVSTRAPTPAQVAAFARVIDDPRNLPVLVHCDTANRAGAMWALYLASKGSALEQALAAGRGVGLKANRETAVRALIASAPNSDVTTPEVSPATPSNNRENHEVPAPRSATPDDENPFDLNAGQDMGC